MWLRAQPRDRGARVWRVLLLSCAGFVAREFFMIKARGFLGGCFGSDRGSDRRMDLFQG